MSRSAAGQRLALVRARLSLPTVRKAAGLFEGAHTSILTGKGHDFEDLAEYSPGDEVRDIDWKVSARAGRPIIRRFERDTDVFTQLVVDTGIEMQAAAPSGEIKSDLALVCAETLAYLGAQRGDRLGIVFGNSAGVERFPARHGLSHLDFILDRAEHALAPPPGGAGAARGRRGRPPPRHGLRPLASPPDRAEHALAGAEAPADVSAVIEFFLHTRRERSLVLLVTDQLWPGPADERLLRRIRERHELLVVRIADMPPTEKGVEAMAEISGNVFLPEYVRDDEVLRKEIEHRRREREEAASALLARYKVLNAPVASSADVLPVIVRLLRGQHREQ